MKVHTIDLQFQDTPQVIACYAFAHNDGVTLVDPGPYATWPQLEAGLTRSGYGLDDVKHVLLTHIHFDHAGAAWACAERGAQIHVHPLGYKHLVDPTRLWQSAARIYGDAAMATLWGEMRGIAEGQLRTWSDGERAEVGGLKVVAHYTPGHAKHHIAWQVAGDALFLGDVGGVRIGTGPVEPPCPPPDIDLEAWRESISKLRGLTGIDKLFPTHFGQLRVAPQVHFDELLGALDRWATYIREHSTEERLRLGSGFEQLIDDERQRAPACVGAYRFANPAAMSVDGLLRYWSTKTTNG